eukprot:12748399-Alexandrium_andersonii.AAC.1
MPHLGNYTWSRMVSAGFLEGSGADSEFSRQVSVSPGGYGRRFVQQVYKCDRALDRISALRAPRCSD